MTRTAPAPPDARGHPVLGPVARPGEWRAGRGSPGGRAPSPARPEATVALLGLTLASCCGLFRVFSTDAWLGPVLVVAIVVHLVSWLLRRVRVGSWVSAPLMLASVLLVTCWTVFGGYTAYGLPGRRLWHQVSMALGDFSNEVAFMAPRVVPTHTFMLLTVVGAGVAAALADWVAFRWRQPLLGVVPGLAIFIFCCVPGVGPGRGAVVALEVAAICLFLLVERATGEGQVWFAGVRAGAGAWSAAIGGLVVAGAVIASLALSPALPPHDGTAVLGWKGSFGHGSGTRIVGNPLVDLRTRLTQYQNTPVFVVTSSVPSYWRLTALDQFDGITWQSSGEYSGFGARLPGSPPAGAAVRTVRATFQIQQLNSDWLPAQFNPLSVQGVRGVTYDPSSNSLLTSKVTAPHLEYAVTSYQYLDTLNSAQLEAAPPLVSSDPVVAKNLALPVLDNRIDQLAFSITAGATDEYHKALAIQNYLRGPLFTYSLSPPSDGSGTQAIGNFLFRTRSGYCQQFAGAYAVLARAVGLPTRLAIGFAEGQPAGADTYQVHDKDAHTWPEVYFGPKLGWVPFEPTKGFAVPGTGAYSGTNSSIPGPVPPTPTTVPNPSSSNPTVPGAGAHTVPKTVPAAASPASVTHHRNGGSVWWLLIPILIVAWPLLIGGARIGRRRLRRNRAAQKGNRAATLNAWCEVGDELLWLGIGRTADETDDEFTVRALQTLERIGADRAGGTSELEILAGMVRRAAFASEVPDDLGSQAVQSARRVEQALISLTPARRRLVRPWLLRPGTWRQAMSALQPRLPEVSWLETAGPGADSAPRLLPDRQSSSWPRRRRIRREKSSTA